MKEKKEKKSLETLDNSLKRSTRLKELARSLPTQQVGTNITSIRTTSSSDLPPSYVISKDSIKMCEFVGSYKSDASYAITNYSYDTTNLTYLGGSNLGSYIPNVAGWYILNDGYIPRTSISNNNYTFNPFNGESGYLFVFFFGKYGIINRVCSGCYYYASQEDSYYPPALCKVIDTNQGEIFTVLIQNISQINALNKTLALNSNRVFLSNTINDAFKSGNPTIKSVIDDLRIRNNDYTTQIISTILLNNPIEIVANFEYINFNEFIVQSDNIRDYAVIPLKKYITSKIFKDGNMGSGIFTVNKNSSILFEGVDPQLAQFNVTIPNINSTNVNNTGVLELPIDDSVNIYITNRYSIVTTRLLTFSVLFTQPSYELTQNTFYLPKTLSLKFMVSF